MTSFLVLSWLLEVVIQARSKRITYGVGFKRSRRCDIHLLRKTPGQKHDRVPLHILGSKQLLGANLSPEIRANS